MLGGRAQVMAGEAALAGTIHPIEVTGIVSQRGLERMLPLLSQDRGAGHRSTDLPSGTLRRGGCDGGIFSQYRAARCVWHCSL